MRQLIIFFLIIISLNPPLLSQVQGELSSDRTAISGSSVLPGVPDILKEKIDSFFGNLITSKVDSAFTGLLAESPINEKKEQIKNLIKQTRLANQRYGDIQGYEAVNSEFVTDSYLRLRYLALHRNFPMRWIFTYYRSPDKGWIVVNIKFDDYTEFFFSDE